MKQLSKITKALADENRIRILVALGSGELCVCQITALLELAPSTVSKHLLILKEAGLIESRKSGRWIFCRLAGKEAPKLQREWIKLLLSSARSEKACCDDKKALKAILRIDPEVLCSRQKRRQLL